MISHEVLDSRKLLELECDASSHRFSSCNQPITPLERPCGTMHGVRAAQTCNRTVRSPRQTASVLIREVHHHHSTNNVRGWSGYIAVTLPAAKCPAFRRRSENHQPDSQSVGCNR